MIEQLGLFNSVLSVIRDRVGTRGRLYELNSRHASHPLYYRAGSSDMNVFHQIFVDSEYLPLSDMPDVHLVIDCGANVGYSSAFFLSQFPSCHVVAVEPDPGNFAMLRKNLSPYGSRVKMVSAGIWSHRSPLKVSQNRYRDGREWSVQVRPCESGETPDFHGVTIDSLLDESGFNRIALLKIDIEGAEAILFQHTPCWLERVDAIAIELHDDSCFGPATRIFHDAIRGQGFEVARSGELTICRRIEIGGGPSAGLEPT